MYHFMLDGFQGYRSRLDDVRLLQELLEELPVELGLEPVMPGFLLPYYNGEVAEDCGVSSFLFLRGGHFTLHTFSFRETYFVDLLSPEPFRTDRLRARLEAALPAARVSTRVATRTETGFPDTQADAENDFGPHLLVEIEDYRGPRTMDAVFELLDRLPQAIGMTPIMRPYVVRGVDGQGGRVLSGLTMIAESHISLHVFEAENRAYFDIFSCEFFDHAAVLQAVRTELPGECRDSCVIPRGKDYRLLRTERADEQRRSRAWLKHAVV